jgi:hypothetical protein
LGQAKPFSSSLFQPCAILWWQKIMLLALAVPDGHAPFYGDKIGHCITSEQRQNR